MLSLFQGLSQKYLKFFKKSIDIIVRDVYNVITEWDKQVHENIKEVIQMTNRTEDFLAGLILLITTVLIIYCSCLGVTKLMEVIL